MTKLNSINTKESIQQPNKYSNFVENTKRAVRKALTTAGIAASSMYPMTATTLANEVKSTKAGVEIADNYTTHYASQYPGTMDEIFTLMGKDGNTTGEKVANLAANPLEYKAITINNIDPESLMPKVEVGDKNVYKHIEHLRIPESTVIRDMMREYGAGDHSAEEYKQLMMRLNTGMLRENPTGYDNYEAVGGTPETNPDSHAHGEWFTLNTLINHANFIVIDNVNCRESLYSFCKDNPTKINILGCSVGIDAKQAEYDIGRRNNINKYKEYDKEKNRLVFCAGTNICNDTDGSLLNKIYQEDYPLPDEHSAYNYPSRAHNENDNVLDRHFVITFATNKDGDLDLTGEEGERSKFPVGFHNKVLFAGRAFSYRNYDGDKIRATGALSTSHPNYLNVAAADLCFQMKADTPDTGTLLDMIRSTALTDYIRLDGETQELQLMNPAGFFQEYLMPTDLPTNLRADKTIDLNKGYYHGVIYQIPGAEVNINGQWISFTDDNKDLILSHNPMNLKWRLNGNLLNNYNYKPGDTIKGQIIVVDDKWNGLNITKDLSINIEDANGINDSKINASDASNTRYTIDGIRLDTKPTKPGIYIINGQKVIMK